MSKNWKLGRRELFLSIAGASAIASILTGKDKLTGDRDEKFAIVETKQRNLARVRDVGLRYKAAAKGLVYGAFPEGSATEIASDDQFKLHFIRECGLMAVGDVWQGIHPEIDRFTFDEIDYFANFARDNNLAVKLDIAVWHEFLPPWLMAKFSDRQTRPAEIEKILSNMVQTVGKRYGERIHSWSVVNEAINVKDGRGDGFRDTLVSGSMDGKKYPSWLHFLDDRYVEIAFRAAAAAAPQATLLYNDFALEYDTREEERKRNEVLEMLAKLKSKGTPIHALGVQAHLNASMNDRFNQEKYRQFLRDVASLGLKIQITELDVADKWLPKDLDLKTRDLLVAQAYYDYLSAALEEPAVDTVVTWGLSDRYTWLSWFAPHEDGTLVRPLPLDEQLNRKLAWNAIAEAFDNAPQRL